MLLGESGLDAAEPRANTLTTAESAPRGLESAIWAEMVSGLATARTLYWEDGYAGYYPPSGQGLVNARKSLEKTAAAWLATQDFRGFVPLELRATPTLVGSAMGDSDGFVGWVRNTAYEAPAWNATPLTGASITVILPNSAPIDETWTVSLTTPEGQTTEVAGQRATDHLSFAPTQPFNQLAFAAHRGNP